MADNKGNAKGRGGFASMDDARQREIASQGGRAAHQSGNAHEFTPEEAREAGRKGGEASHGGQSQNQNRKSEGSQSSSARGGTADQHSEAGRQSHKNS